MSSPEALLLVATHPRSGTHLAINSLCLNFRGLRFGLVREQFPTLERLLLDHDSAYAREFEAYVAGSPGQVTIVKTHMRPSDVRLALENAGFLSPSTRHLVDRVFSTAARLHVHRDGRDTLVSWFHYMRDAGGGFPSDLPPRLRELTFTEFLQMPNKYYPCIRGFRPEDENRPRFWASCVEEWLDDPRTVQAAFESLRRDPAATLTELAAAFGWRDRLLPTEKLAVAPLLKPPAKGPLGRRLQRLQRAYLALYHRRARGIEAFPPPPPFARRGTSGGWRTYFSNEDHDFFMENAGATQRRLGHE